MTDTTELGRLQHRLTRIAQTHRQWENTPWCDACRQAWPCETRKLATGDGDD